MKKINDKVRKEQKFDLDVLIDLHNLYIEQGRLSVDDAQLMESMKKDLFEFIDEL